MAYLLNVEMGVEQVNPLINSFETIFYSVGEQLPEPEFSIRLGYRGPSRAYGVPPRIHSSFKGTRLNADIFTVTNRKTINDFLKQAEETVNNREGYGLERYNQLDNPPEGKVVVHSMDAPVAEQYRSVFDKEQAVSFFNQGLFPYSKDTYYNLTFSSPIKSTHPIDHLLVEFPDNTLVERFNLYLPRANYILVSDKPPVTNNKTDRSTEHLKSLAQKTWNELSPSWYMWASYQENELIEKDKDESIAILKERLTATGAILEIIGFGL